MAAKVAGVALGWTAFSVTHLTLSHPPIRKDVIDKIGKDKFLGLYSAVSLATFIPTVWFYARHAHSQGPRLWTGTSMAQRGASLGLKAAGAVLLSQAVFTQPLIEVRTNEELAEKKKLEDLDSIKVEGVNRISRHSLFMSFALLGLGNLVTRGFLSDIVFWSGFPVFTVIGCMHQDQRLKADKVLPPSFFHQTSLLPLQAVLEGKQDVEDVKKEFNAKAALIALLAPLFFL